MIGLAIITPAHLLFLASTGLLVLTLAALRAGIAVERRRNLAAWEAATDQAIALTQTIRDADAEQWAEVARALDPTNEYRG